MQPSVLTWASAVRLWADAERADAMRPGHDLVLEPPDEHFTELPVGALLDDLFDAEARRALDAEALERLEAWRTARAATLTFDGLDLTWVWYVELLAEVFHHEVRLVSGLERVLGAGVERVEVVGADHELTGCLAAALDRRGVDVVPTGPLPVPTGYPRQRAAPWRIPLYRRLYRSLLQLAGVPPWVRGNVLVLPYWHVAGLYERMRRSEGLVPITDPAFLPALSSRRLLSVLRAGGWVGRPNVLQIRRSARRLAAGLQAARREPRGSDDPLDALLDVRALRLIEQRASATLADVRSVERSLRRKRVRGVLLSWDSPPAARTVLAAARRAGKPAVLIEHGFWAEPIDPDKTASDAAGVWSETVRRELAPRAQGRVVVTGNPGVTAWGADAPRGRDCTVIMPEYASRMSTWVPARVVPDLLEAALEALERVRPGTLALVRPHPADYDPDGYAALAERFPALRVEVDVASPIDAVVERADLCIGGVSTAMLQAARVGVPIIFLNVARVARPWPFDGSGAIATAETADELAPLVTDAVAGRGQPERQVIEEALGIRADAPERVLALLQETFSAPPGGGAAAQPRDSTALTSS